jgi:hypothetical protein
MAKQEKERFSVQHEFDYDPTYVVDSNTSDEDIVTFGVRLPWELRVKLAKLVCDELNKANPTLITDDELDKMIEQG